jgi:nicotinamide riboside kinase
MTKGKEEMQAKAEVAVEIDLETQTVTLTALAHLAHPNHAPKEKAKVARRKANLHLLLIPSVIANQKNHAATAVAQTTPHEPATRDRTTKRMRRIKHLINKPTSTYR